MAYIEDKILRHGHFEFNICTMNKRELLENWMLWRAQQLGRKYQNKELAADSNTSPQYISAILNGRRKIGMDVLERLARAFGVSQSEFLAGPPHMKDRKEIPETTYLGPVEETDMVPLLTSIPAGPWKTWVDSYPAGYGEGMVPRRGVRGEYVFAVRVEGDSMVPDLMPNDILYINPELVFDNIHGGMGVVKFNGAYKVRNIWRRCDNYLLEPSNKAYDSELIPVTGTTIFDIEGIFRDPKKRPRRF